MVSEELKVGQRVWIYDVNDRRDEEPKESTIVRVGRKLVTIGEGWGKQDYRIDTQSANDNYGHQSFKTDGQRQESERRKRAVASLKEFGLEIRLGVSPSKLTTDQLENVVRCLSVTSEQ